jgi:hypothetical protein
MSGKWLVSAAMVAMAAAMLPANAHHSFAMYENEKTLMVLGTVAEYRWANPHVVIVVSGKSVPTEAADQLWTLELPAPGQLTRSGWTHSTLKVGDKVKAELHPFRDGRLGGAFVSVTTPDGQKITR